MSASFDFMSASANDKIRHLEARLTEALQPQSVHIDDDSAAHAGHAGAREGAHFNLRIVSAKFAGLPRISRHRLVYDALRPWMAEGVHALAIDARTPEEA